MLFTGDMVRRILAGQKNQTRRLAFKGEPGDLIWVKETWAHDAESTEELRAKLEDFMSDCTYGPFYRAEGKLEDAGMKWRPSIYMPRFASRITLEVVSARWELLHSISEEDAIAEGIKCFTLKASNGTRTLYGLDGWKEYADSAREAYFMLWTSLHGAESLNLNPLVCRVEFKRLEGCIDKNLIERGVAA